MSNIVRMCAALLLMCAASASAAGLLNNVTQVSAGGSHTCALLGDGSTACWGSNSWGELGDGSTRTRGTPNYVIDRDTGLPFAGFEQVVTGSSISCGLISGDVYCWGYTYPGVAQPFPTRVAIGAPVKMIAAKWGFVCALLATPQRSARCWGDNVDGQLGDGTKTSRGTPADIVITERDGSHVLLAGLTQIAVGTDHACAVLDDTSVACWGLNWAGELGNATFSDSTSPVGVVGAYLYLPKLYDVESIAVDGLHSCAKLASTKQMTCWGNNSQGQLGDPSVHIDVSSPVALALGVAAIDAGNESTCAMLADGRLACWGGNTFGQLANGSTSRVGTPTVVTAIPKITSLSVGVYHACAVVPDATVRCWGRGDSGEVGDGAMPPLSRSTPVAVVGLP